MKLKAETIRELGTILKDEFNLSLPKSDLEKLAYCLVGYFSLLIRVDKRD